MITRYYWHCRKCKKFFRKQTHSHVCKGTHSVLERFEFQVGVSK